MINELSKDLKLEVLNLVLLNYKKDIKNDPNEVTGLCRHFKRIIQMKIGNSSCFHYEDIETNIPEFSLENVTLLSKKYEFNLPNKPSSGYWWALSEVDTRISTLNALISEISTN